MSDNNSILALNELKSKAALGAFFILYCVIGLLVDTIIYNMPSLSHGFYMLLTFQVFPMATVGMAVFGVVSIMVTYSMYDKIMLFGHEYKEITPENAAGFERRLYDSIDSLAAKAGLGYMPRVYVIEADYMNAFASGFSQKSAMVAITTTLISRLNEDEIRAVMAHEISHIKHGDIKLTLLISVLANVMLFVVNIGVMFFGGSRDSGGARAAKMILLVLQFVLPLITGVLSMFLSRSREYMADAGSVEITGDKDAMANALIKIHNNYAAEPHTEDDGVEFRKAAYIFEPKSFASLFSTHPSLEDRLKALGFAS